MTKYEILTPDGWSDFSGVRKKKIKGTVHIFTSGMKDLECTFDHMIKTPYGFMPADTLEIDDKILTVDGYERIHNIHIDKEKEIDVYDALNVDLGKQYHTNGIVSHNCEFQGSSGTLIDGATLKAMVSKTPIAQADGFSVYEPKKEGHTYIITVDVSRGKGLDYSAFQVVDVTTMPYKLVCSFRSNMLTPIDYSEYVYRSIKQYNDAYTLIEINDIGEQVADILHFDYEVETLMFTESAGRMGKRISGGFGSNVDKGIRTTKSVKAIGCNMLKMMVEQNQLIINDFFTIQELSTFSRKGQSYEAEPGCYDDLTMCLVLFGWLSDQTFFKDITDIDTMQKLKEMNDEQVLENMMPLGFNTEDVFEEIEQTQSHSQGWFNY